MQETNNFKKSNLIGKDKKSTKRAGLTFCWGADIFCFVNGEQKEYQLLYLQQHYTLKEITT